MLAARGCLAFLAPLTPAGASGIRWQIQNQSEGRQYGSSLISS